MPYLYSFDAKMLSPFPKTASCVYSLGTGKIPCPTQKSWLHRKLQSPFSAQMIKARFKKALYAWQAQQITDDQGCHGPFWGGLHLIHRSGLQSYLLPPVSAPNKLDWCYCGLGSSDSSFPVSKVQKLLHNPYTIGIGENRSFPQLKEHRKVGVYSHKTGILPKKQRGKKSEKFIYAEKTKLVFCFYSWQKNAVITFLSLLTVQWQHQKCMQ